MRKRFWGSMVLFLFAAFSILTFVAISDEECKGPSICAGAWIKGSSKKRAKARVSSPRSVRGQWGYRVVAGTKKQSDSDFYSKGYSSSWSVSDYTATASAYAQNRGQDRDGAGYFASASKSSGG